VSRGFRDRTTNHAISRDNARVTRDLEDARAHCERALNLHGIRPPSAFLDELVTLGDADIYGEGGAVTSLESEVAALLGKPAAVFMPSGTMAQQIALRIHCDRRNLYTFGCHPTSHLLLHEDNAHHRLHGLVAVPCGDRSQLITMDDLVAVIEPMGAFLFELPQREIGGRLPEWPDLERQVEYVRKRGIAVHLDGARLWECTPYYGRDLKDIAALFDSVYVSFYKGLGGVSGSCLVGEEDVIAEARVWRHRHGGTLWSLWPLAASALGAMRKRLRLMPRYYEHALAIAAALRDIPDVEVVPETPQTPSMHLHMRTTAERFEEAVRAVAEETGVWTWTSSYPADTPSIRIAELAVGDATLEFPPQDVVKIIGRFVSSS
jgi:threonine aldolase